MLEQNPDIAYHAWRNVIEPQPVPTKSALQKVRGFLGNIIPSLAEVNPYSLMALGKDISHYDDLTADDPRVKGVDFLVVKLGGSENNPRTVMGNPYLDEKFNRYAQLAWDLDVPLIVYWMNGVRVYFDRGMTELNLRQCDEHTHPVFSDVLDGGMLKGWHSGAGWKQVKEFFFDYEEPNYWMDAPFVIDEYWTRLFVDELRDRLVHKMAADEQPYPFKRIPLGLYSRRSFLDQHYQGGKNPTSIWDWLIAHPEMSTWPANYPRAIPNTATVAEVRRDWLPLATWHPYALRDDGSWTYWQFAGDPDWDLYNGTKEELYTRLGYVPHGPIAPPPPVPGTTVTVATTLRPVNVRLVPTTINNTAVKLLPTGFKFEVVETKAVGSDVWRRGPGFIDLWVADKVANVQYLNITEEIQ